MRNWLAIAAVLLVVGCKPASPANSQGDSAGAVQTTTSPGASDLLSGAPHTGGPGEEVFKTICANCHETGVDRAPQTAMLKLMAPESVLRALTSGVMKNQGDQLTSEQRQAVAEYITGRKLGSTVAAAPPPPCKTAQAAFTAGSPTLEGWGLAAGNARVIPQKTAGIAPADLPRLKVSWALAYPNALRARSQPAVAWNAVFVGSQDGTVYALDRATGCAHWTYQAPAEVRTGIVAGQMGAKRVLWFGDLIGNVFALDAMTGKEIWRARPDSHPNATITAAPAFHEGRLYVSVSSLEVLPAAQPTYSCCTFRGSVVAFDAASGKEIWRTYTIPQAATPQQPNARGVVQRGPSGAPVWNTPTIDPKRHRLYVGDGENYSSPASNTSDSVIAMDLATGKVAWIYQATSHDAWNGSCMGSDRTNCPKENGPDHDFGAATILAHTDDGRDILVAGQKSGVVHALDPDTGRLLWKVKLGRGGTKGGVHFGMAVSGERVFVPISDDPDGQTYKEAPRPGLYALDLKTGALLWKSITENVCHGREFCNPGISSAITATPQYIMAEGMDGWLRIHDVNTGKVLWAFDIAREFATVSGAKATGGSMSGGSGPIAVDGMLYVNSGYGFAGKMPGNLFLAFSLAPAH